MSYKQILQKRAIKGNTGRALSKMTPYQILGKPVITEKAYKLSEEQNTYTFKVNREANKADIIQSLEFIYEVTPLSVRICNVPSKGRMNRKLVRKAYKKAYVSLKKGESIALAG